MSVGSMGPNHLLGGGREPELGTSLGVQCIAWGRVSQGRVHYAENPAQVVSRTCELTRFPSRRLNGGNLPDPSLIGH